MAVTRREFSGPWNGYGATHPTVKEKVVVEGSSFSSKDIFVQAGCQKGFLHVTTALELAKNLFAAVEELLPSISTSYVVEVTDPRGGKHQYSGVTEIVARKHTWYLMDGQGTVTGPHDAAEGWVFQVVLDPLVENLRTYINIRKEVKTSEPQAGEPESAA
jgi:hypothetical protein